MVEEYPLLVPQGCSEIAPRPTTRMNLSRSVEVATNEFNGITIRTGITPVVLDGPQLEALVEFIHRETGGPTTLVNRIIRETVALDRLTEKLQEES